MHEEVQLVESCRKVNVCNAKNALTCVALERGVEIPMP